MTEKYIEAFKQISTPTISTAEDLLAWQGKAINIIVRVYGEDSMQEQQVKNVLFRTYTSFYSRGHHTGGGNNSKLCEKQASEVINGLISDITNFGLPQLRVTDKNSGINISLIQNQTQTVKLKVILDVVKDELTGKQIKEIEELLQEVTTPENKKIKVIEKLKSFGADVATNIVATLLTNPNIF